MLEQVAPDYFMDFEDIDLGWRCRLAGWSPGYVPEAIVLHELHGSVAAHPDGFVKRQCTRNRIRLVLGNGSARYLVGAVFRLVKDMGWLLVDSPRREFGPRCDEERGSL
jgi:GT2 family glycosyltransferase